MSKTAIRRHHEARIRAKYHHVHWNISDWNDPEHLDCWCTKEPGYYYSKHPFSCTCSKKRKGRPRLASGMCGIGERERVYKWRQQRRHLNRAVTERRYIDWNSDEATLLTDAKIFDRWGW